MPATDQIKLHCQCIQHGNYRKPSKLWFHIKGIGRAIPQLLDALLEKLSQNYSAIL